MKTTIILFSTLITTILAAPYVVEPIRRGSGEGSGSGEGEGSDEVNIVDVLPEGVTDLASGIVDSIPVDVSVSAPVIPEKRGIMLKKRSADLEVDMGGVNADVKRKADLEVDMGGVNADVK
jgi:hypothetical protein